MISRFSKFSHNDAGRVWPGGLLLFLAVMLAVWMQGAYGQHPAPQKLTLAQIEGLVSHGVPDSTLAVQIQKRGLAFKPTPAIIESLRARGAGSLTLAAVETAGPGGTNRETPRMPVQSPGDASSGLSQARRVIPIELKAIFHALDEGNPQGAGQFISPDISNNARILDSICRPFNYRAHYVEAIIERPGPVFEVRIHALYKPFDEHAVILTFRESGGAFQLVQFSDSVDEWFSAAKETAIQTARKFLYAARAHEAGVIASLVTGGIDPSPYTTETCWQQAFDHINDVSWTGVSLEDLHGLKIHVTVRSTMNTRIFLASEALSDFWFDKVGDEYKIVAFVPMRQDSIFLQNDPPQACRNLRGNFFARVEVPNLEQKTLIRFGLLRDSQAAPPPEQSGTNEMSGKLNTSDREPNVDISSAVATSLLLEKHDPVYPPIAKAARISGTVVLRAAISKVGSVEELEVVSGPVMLRQAAMEAVKIWRYNPFIYNNRPVNVTTRVNVLFTLGDDVAEGSTIR